MPASRNATRSSSWATSARRDRVGAGHCQEVLAALGCQRSFAAGQRHQLLGVRHGASFRTTTSPFRCWIHRRCNSRLRRPGRCRCRGHPRLRHGCDLGLSRKEHRLGAHHRQAGRKIVRLMGNRSELEQQWTRGGKGSERGHRCNWHRWPARDARCNWCNWASRPCRCGPCLLRLPKRCHRLVRLFAVSRKSQWAESDGCEPVWRVPSYVELERNVSEEHELQRCHHERFEPGGLGHPQRELGEHPSALLLPYRC